MKSTVQVLNQVMNKTVNPSPAGLGFTVKSGWAAAVLLTGTRSSPCVAESQRTELSDPAISGSRQPYHQGFGTARTAGPELSCLIGSVLQFGTQSVAALIKGYKASEHKLAGAGVVVGSLSDPGRITNDHVRIHALEGRLFRQVVEDAARAISLQCSVWRERDLYAVAATALGKPEQHVRATLAGLRDSVAGPWRAEQKSAALAAWLVLAGAPWAGHGPDMS